jgi:hypothetical protein
MYAAERGEPLRDHQWAPVNNVTIVITTVVPSGDANGIVSDLELWME